ncbi:MAG TPA: shikimate dehydrogenase [Dehalococcoidales bacterium]|nr:shikimate dehydrogenase [Dehalococcoidales bacterium]
MRNSISGKTSLLALIGDPVEHSLSPVMQNAAFQVLGLDYVYVTFRVKQGDVEKAVAGIRAMNMRGLNVTMPHKVTVMPLLDNIDPMAEKIGAVNTIVNNDGKLTGYNTDATGFLQALAEKSVEPAGQKVVLLGAGGVARAIGFALAEEGAHLVILNRKEEVGWAKDLATRIGQSYGVPVAFGEMDRDTVGDALENADIVVNATSVGMSPGAGQTPVEKEFICSKMVVFDAVYNPVQTRLLREAREQKAKAIDGLDMLVYQGAAAFEKWTGQAAPVDVMRQSALKAL